MFCFTYMSKSYKTERNSYKHGGTKWYPYGKEEIKRSQV